jgi:hemerythrin-like domain-containing protein
MVTSHDPGNPDRTAAPADGFTALDECHRQTLAAIAKIEVLVDRLEGNAPDPATRALAAEVVRHFSTTARQHHIDEERHVFPALAASGDSVMQQTLLELQQDHHWLEEDWMALLPALDAIACGQSWYDVETLREGSAIFVELSRDHIALEENCLYPAARARLSAADQRVMANEMAARRAARRG